MSNLNSSDASEIMLAQEQSVTHKTGLGREIQGTLILTNKRLLFIAGKESEEDFRTIIAPNRLRYSDVDDLTSIPSDPSNLSISLSELELEKGHSGIIHRPSLTIKWLQGGTEKKAEFSEDITDRTRKKNLNDWAKVIDSLRQGKQIIQYASSPPGRDTLEGRILFILGDMQDKGVFEIEEQVEKTFKVDLDPDQVDSVCASLVTKGFVNRIADRSGDNFYRKRSPLGEDDLSS